MNRKYTDEQRFQLDIPLEQEDTRAEDEYDQEGLLYNDLNRVITGYRENGVFDNHEKSVAFILRMLLEKTEKENKE